MRIAIIGAGGIGGYYGARLAAAGEDVVFVARGANLQALRERGLRVTSPLGDVSLPQVRATDDTSQVGPVDLILFCVKTYGTADALALLSPLVGPTTVIISLQNGLDAADHLAAAVGRERVLGGLTAISAQLVAPGEVRHAGTFASVTVGELDGPPSPRADMVAAAFRAAGVDADVSDDIERDLWLKFMFIAVHGPLTALTGQPLGAIRDCAPTWQLYQDAVREIEAVARARGVRLPRAAAEGVIAGVAGIAPTMRSSMAADFEHGRRLENEDFSGTVVRLGEAAGVPTPIHRMLYALLGPADYQAATTAQH